MANKIYGFTYKENIEDQILTLKKFEMSYDDACKEVITKVMGYKDASRYYNNFIYSFRERHGYILVDNELTIVYCDSQEERDGCYNEFKEDHKANEYAIIERIA